MKLIKELSNDELQTYLNKCKPHSYLKVKIAVELIKRTIKIKDGVNERSFNDVELKELEEMQQMMNKGYELRLVRLRKGSKIMWGKNR
jgi:muconolactone delta-isomerase